MKDFHGAEKMDEGKRPHLGIFHVLIAYPRGAIGEKSHGKKGLNIQTQALLQQQIQYINPLHTPILHDYTFWEYATKENGTTGKKASKWGREGGREGGGSRIKTARGIS